MLARTHNYCLLGSILLNFAVSVYSVSREFTYSASSQCLDRGCVTQVQERCRSLLECATWCSERRTCVGFSSISSGNCTHLQDGCFFNTTCLPEEPSLPVYQKQHSACKNTGQWDQQLQMCKCSDGWVGNRCERKAYSCKELQTFGYSPGTYRVTIDVYRNQSRLVYTQCYITNKSCQTFIFAADGTQNHNKRWDEYLNGYEIGRWNIWLGLENILAFNRMGHVTVAFLVVVQQDNFIWRYGYKNFHLDDASGGYAFTCDLDYNTSYGSQYRLANRYSLSDVLGMSQGLEFSSPDMDQAEDSENCAALYAAGWWHNCTSGQHVNPLGYNPKYASSSSPPLTHMSLPDINMNDQEIMDNFQSVLMFFVD